MEKFYEVDLESAGNLKIDSDSENECIDSSGSEDENTNDEWISEEYDIWYDEKGLRHAGSEEWLSELEESSNKTFSSELNIPTITREDYNKRNVVLKTKYTYRPPKCTPISPKIVKEESKQTFSIKKTSFPPKSKTNFLPTMYYSFINNSNIINIELITINGLKFYKIKLIYNEMKREKRNIYKNINNLAQKQTTLCNQRSKPDKSNQTIILSINANNLRIEYRKQLLLKLIHNENEGNRISGKGNENYVKETLNNGTYLSPFSIDIFIATISSLLLIITLLPL